MVYTPPLLHAYRSSGCARVSMQKRVECLRSKKLCARTIAVPDTLLRQSTLINERERSCANSIRVPTVHPRNCQPVQCIDGTHPLRQKRRHAHYNLRLRKQGKTGPRLSRHASQGLAAWILTEKGRRERMTCAHSSPYNREALPAENSRVFHFRFIPQLLFLDSFRHGFRARIDKEAAREESMRT